MATQAHCAYCFEALVGHLESRDPLPLEEVQSSWAAYGQTVPSAKLAADAVAAAESPLFVTWDTVAGAERALRGCIGTFEAQRLDEGLATYAVTAAVDDTRFAPVAAGEVAALAATVTLLQQFEPCADALDWELGRHGLRIAFEAHGRRLGATYLPDVAPEQGWSKEQTVVSLMRKAGWSGNRGRWRDIHLDVVRYQGSKASLTYPEYRNWLDWRASHAAEAK